MKLFITCSVVGSMIPYRRANDPREKYFISFQPFNLTVSLTDLPQRFSNALLVALVSRWLNEC